MKKTNLLTSGILYSPQVFRYKTKDGRAVFAFSYHYQDGHYIVAIHQLPDYRGRDAGSLIAHWLPFAASPVNKKICFTAGYEPTSLEQAKKNSIQYAEVTWTYILTGITIDQQLASRN